MAKIKIHYSHFCVFTKKTTYSGSKQSNYLCSQIYKIIPNSDINGLATLHAAFLALLHAQLTGYTVPVMKNIYKNLMIYKAV